MSKLDEALTELTDKQLKFWELYNTGKMTQVQAYRKAFDVDLDRENTGVQVDASRLWNNPNFILCRNALTQGISSQSIKSKEVRIAEMMALAIECQANGQYGAAVKANELVGKLEGHYIDRTENVNKTRDQLTSLKQIADSLGVEKALELAAQVGLEDKLAEHLASLH